jgi:orotidine-5'-phosphate decarboxylase
VSGKHLGEFIKAFKQQFADFETFLLENSTKTIEQVILDFSL